jgi:hypothetical protein
MHIRNLVIRPNKSLLCENKTMTEWERVAWQDASVPSAAAVLWKCVCDDALRGSRKALLQLLK